MIGSKGTKEFQKTDVYFFDMYFTLVRRYVINDFVTFVVMVRTTN